MQAVSTYKYRGVTFTSSLSMGESVEYFAYVRNQALTDVLRTMWRNVL